MSVTSTLFSAHWSPEGSMSPSSSTLLPSRYSQMPRRHSRIKSQLPGGLQRVNHWWDKAIVKQWRLWNGALTSEWGRALSSDQRGGVNDRPHTQRRWHPFPSGQPCWEWDLESCFTCWWETLGEWASMYRLRAQTTEDRVEENSTNEFGMLIVYVWIHFIPGCSFYTIIRGAPGEIKHFICGRRNYFSVN